MDEKNQKEYDRGIIENKIEEYAGCIIAFVIFVFLVGILSYVVDKFHTNKIKMNDIIVFCTMLVLIWYTWETSKLRKEAQKQTELNLRPFVILYVEYDKDIKRDYIQLKNVGNGTAINIRVKDVKITSEIQTDILQSVSSVPILTSGETCSVSYLDTIKPIEGKEPIVDSSLRNNFNPLRTQNTILVSIEFENVNGKSYFVEESVSPSRFKITNFGATRGNV